MAGKVAVLIIHGMGSQKKAFADKTKVEINRRIAKADKDPDQVVWQSIYWANLIEPRQSAFMRAIINEPDNDIDCIRLRKFVVSAIGDAAAYQSFQGKQTSTYTAIHERVKENVKELYEVKLGEQECPLVIMAHSLGGHIMSNYIWDIKRDGYPESSDFENMKHLAGMITFGCNIPLFAFAHNDMEPFKFPGESLSEADAAKAKWINFYDPDDVLGYPLRQINGCYDFIEDVHINAGGILTSWNPMSHSGYWTDNDMTKPAARFIGGFI